MPSRNPTLKGVRAVSPTYLVQGVPWGVARSRNVGLRHPFLLTYFLCHVRVTAPVVHACGDLRLATQRHDGVPKFLHGCIAGEMQAEQAW